MSFVCTFNFREFLKTYLKFIFYVYGIATSGSFGFHHYVEKFQYLYWFNMEAKDLKCCVNGCDNGVQNEVRFFKFPTDHSTCLELLALIGREDLKNISVSELREHFFLCSVHFVDGTESNLEEVNCTMLTGSDIFKCVSCSQHFDNETSLYNHCSEGCTALTFKNEDPAFGCEHCRQFFPTQDDLSLHFDLGCPALRGSTEPDFIPTFECKSNSGYNSILSTKPETFSFDNGTLRKLKPKVICCPICPKKFANPNGLKNHIKIHNNDRQFACSECGKSFTVMSCLKTHMNTIHSDKKYQCHKCFKCYQSEHYLRTHLRIHEGRRDFECSVCQKKFVDSQALKLHLRIHSGERPYKCQVCGKSFIQQSHLKTHQRIHTGEKPFQCKVCGKYFRQLSNIKEHERVHLPKNTNAGTKK